MFTFELKVLPYAGTGVQGSRDDSAVNGIRMTCVDLAKTKLYR